MSFSRYYTDRSRSIEIKADAAGIESDCNVITFINDGDCPCYIVSESGVRRYLDQFQEIGFGSDRPEVSEREKFKIEFDATYVGAPGVKSVWVERGVYRDDSRNCEL